MSRSLRAAAFFSLVGLILFGCGYAGSPPVKEVVVLIDPSAASVALGQTQQFQASITGAANATITWDVNDVPGGSSTPGASVAS